MKNKGFTLIELLAVIVILAIIALIATPIILNVIENVRQGSAEQSTLSYIQAVEKQVVMSQLTSDTSDDIKLDNEKNKFDVKTTTTLEKVEMKGTKPSEGKIVLNAKGKATADTCLVVEMNGKKYNIGYDGNGKVAVQDRCSNIEIKVGDYVRMTPTSTSYTISKDSTGCNMDQVINPSELNIWRVIKINEDGTIEMVSENVSSTKVNFKGQTGYLNIVGTLNEIASQYENDNYTINSRIMGYNGQTEYINDTSKFTNPAPWTSFTKDNSNEALGGGDIMYLEDTNLVTEVLGTLAAKTPSGIAASYWLGSRYYYYSTPTYYGFIGRYVFTSGSIITVSLYTYYSGWSSSTGDKAIRPILTLKSELTATGSGTSEDPWVLE